MKYPHKEDLFRVLNKEIEFNEFLNIFSEVNNFDKEHPVFNMIYYVKDILEKNSNEMLNSKIDGGTLFSAMNLKLDEVYSEMKAYSSNSSRMGEKDGYDISELEIGYKFCKDLIDKICYAYSENY